MRVGVTGSRGLIGRALLPALRGAGHAASRLVRAPELPGASDWSWDPATGALSGQEPGGLDAVVHLAGEPIGGSRWTPAFRTLLRASRIEPTRPLSLPPPPPPDPP